MFVAAALAAATIAAQAHDNLVEVIVDEMRVGIFDEIKTMCADEWPHDFVMQEHCVETQKEAYLSVQAFDTMASTDATIIWASCAVKWKDNNDRHDWVMMHHCISEQDAARQSLQSQ